MTVQVRKSDTRILEGQANGAGQGEANSQKYSTQGLLCGKCTRALTFESLSQGKRRGR